jgi:hypothetical protein
MPMVSTNGTIALATWKYKYIKRENLWQTQIQEKH